MDAEAVDPSSRVDGTDFHAAYRELGKRMRQLAEEKDGDVFLPGPEPRGPADYVLIAMEPSLGTWAMSKDEACSKVADGFRNFLSSVEDFILHFCIRRYLCGMGERYYITDISKGAMLTKPANLGRRKRYDDWYELLQEEIDLVAMPNAGIVAIGNAVASHLKLRGFGRPFTPVLHYSGQAARARNDRIRGHEESFKRFINSVSRDDLIDTAEKVLGEACVPHWVCEKPLSRLKSLEPELSRSRQKLIFCYKLAFEAMPREICRSAL
jgi:hypothetical protein